MNRLKIYSDKDCTKEINLLDDNYIFQQHTSTIERDIEFHFYIKNISKNTIDTLKVTNKTNNGVMLNNVSSTIEPNEVLETTMKIRITKLDNKKYFEVVCVDYKPIYNGDYDGLSKTKLEYLVGKPYQYVVDNDEHQDVKIKVSIITPIKTYKLDILFITKYEHEIQF